MKPFEEPRIEIERFTLVDTLAVSLVPDETLVLPTLPELPDDDF